MTTPTPSADQDPESGAHPGGDETPTGDVGLVTTTVRTPTQNTGRHAAPEAAADRGSLSIEDVVVEKVARAAAGEVEHVGGAARRLLGVPTSREDGDGLPRISARVAGQVVALDVRLVVSYPASVRATTEAVRAHVRDRVHALTELTVTRVDITVAGLTRTHTSNDTRRVIA